MRFALKWCDFLIPDVTFVKWRGHAVMWLSGAWCDLGRALVSHSITVSHVHWCPVTGHPSGIAEATSPWKSSCPSLKGGALRFFFNSSNEGEENDCQCPSMPMNHCKTPSPQERVWLDSHICIVFAWAYVRVSMSFLEFNLIQESSPDDDTKEALKQPRRSKKDLLTPHWSSLLDTDWYWSDFIESGLPGSPEIPRQRPGWWWRHGCVREKGTEKSELACYSQYYENFPWDYWTFRMYPSRSGSTKRNVCSGMSGSSWYSTSPIATCHRSHVCGLLWQFVVASAGVYRAWRHLLLHISCIEQQGRRRFWPAQDKTDLFFVRWLHLWEVLQS